MSIVSCFWNLLHASGLQCSILRSYSGFHMMAENISFLQMSQSFTHACLGKQPRPCFFYIFICLTLVWEFLFCVWLFHVKKFESRGEPSVVIYWCSPTRTRLCKQYRSSRSHVLNLLFDLACFEVVLWHPCLNISNVQNPIPWDYLCMFWCAPMIL